MTSSFIRLKNSKAIAQRDDAQHRLRMHGQGLDVSAVPSFGYGHRSLMWWATLGLIAIESTVFALAVMTYFYLQAHAHRWPPTEPPPALLWGSVNTALFLASFVPAYLTKQAAECLDLPRVRLWLTVSTAASLLILVVRGLEFANLHCSWESSAYGSAVWMLLGLHTVHLVTDAWDSGVLNVLMFTGPLEGKRFVDVSENALYWFFVVFSWLPIYAVIYWAPRGT
jgi:heme/copper-type cytochrome/quinol oxidase subunit 3